MDLPLLLLIGAALRQASSSESGPSSDEAPPWPVPVAPPPTSPPPGKSPGPVRRDKRGKVRRVKRPARVPSPPSPPAPVAPPEAIKPEAKPKPKPKAKPAYRGYARPKADAPPPPEPTKPKAKPKAKPKPKPKPTATIQPVPAGMTAAERAARELSEATSSGLRMMRSWVAVRQWAMDKLDPDGLPGPTTRAKAEEILQQSIPWGTVSPEGGVPVFADPALNAEALWRYVHVWKGARSERIAAYQKALGLDPVGKVGPQTKAKVKELTGLDW